MTDQIPTASFHVGEGCWEADAQTRVASAGPGTLWHQGLAPCGPALVNFFANFTRGIGLVKSTPPSVVAGLRRMQLILPDILAR